MMNWRMLGLRLSSLTSPIIGWTIAGSGMAFTALLTFYLWLGHTKWDATKFAVALMGTMAATGILAWHSHFHIPMILLPPLIYLSLKNILPWRLLDIWVFIPPAMLFFIYILGVLHALGVISVPTGYGSIIMGNCYLILSLYLLGWAVIASRKSYMGQHLME